MGKASEPQRPAASRCSEPGSSDGHSSSPVRMRRHFRLRQCVEPENSEHSIAMQPKHGHAAHESAALSAARMQDCLLDASRLAR